MADAEDAAQSAFISFWQRAERGDFAEDLDRQNLWNLLGVITVRKALKQVERERTQKRGGGLVRGESDVAAADVLAGETFRLDQVLGQLPAQDMDLYCEDLLLQLTDELREIALFRLWGWSTPEIADQLQCTERKVQRKLELIRLKWAHLAAD
jgi:DNA-directed RNA polymerase specialized sigma24 family protein